jgi:hypothetical protein
MKTCFIVLFLFPLATVPFILIGIARKRQSGRSMFTVAIYLCYIYVFCTLIIFAIHVIVTAVASDACVYGDKVKKKGRKKFPRGEMCWIGRETERKCSFNQHFASGF